MKKFTVFCIIFYFMLSVGYSQKNRSNDTIRTFGSLILRTKDNKLWNVYDPERGYFQKAFTDKGDPRFMIANEDETFKFGLGGFVKVIGFLDFNGMVENRDFVTSQIPIPLGRHSGQFALGAESSRINFKAVGKTKYGDVVAFLETDFRGSSNALRLRHAYISYFGFTVGQTWSTFMDLEAGPPTIDLEGPNTQIALRQPMIRYSHSFNNGISLSLALEMNHSLIDDYSEIGIQTEYPKYPDIPFHLKYKGKFGHIQLAAILRPLNYYDDTITHKSQSQLGFGLALSGKFNITKSTFLFFQGVYGEGIAQYIQDLSFANLDLVPDTKQAGKLKTLPMLGAYLAMQQNWTNKLYSAVMYGITILNPPTENITPNLFARTHYFAINLFWDFIPWGTMGIEYLFGKRVNQSKEFASANRIDIMFRYGF